MIMGYSDARHVDEATYSGAGWALRLDGVSGGSQRAGSLLVALIFQLRPENALAACANACKVSIVKLSWAPSLVAPMALSFMVTLRNGFQAAGHYWWHM
jgi:hypothetical protein